MASNSTDLIKHISIDNLKPYENKSNNGSINENMSRYTFTSNKLMSIDEINDYVIDFFDERYNTFRKIKNKSLEFNFCTKNNGRFGITDWIPLDQALSEDEWTNEISKIDINKTLSLYDGDEKVFEENIKRDKFWLTLRLRPNIGYGVGFCFFDALREANVINIIKHKIV